MGNLIVLRELIATAEGQTLDYFSSDPGGPYGRQLLLETEEGTLPIPPGVLLGHAEQGALRDAAWFSALAKDIADSLQTSEVDADSRLTAVQQDRDRALGVISGFGVQYGEWRGRAEDRLSMFDLLREASGVPEEEAGVYRKVLPLPLREQWKHHFGPSAGADLDSALQRFVVLSMMSIILDAANKMAASRSRPSGRKKASNQQYLYQYSIMKVASEDSVEEIDSHRDLLLEISGKFGTGGEGWPHFSYGKIARIITKNYLVRLCGFSSGYPSHPGKALRAWYVEHIKDHGNVPFPLWE